MQREKSNVTITSEDIIRLIMDEKITIWDLSIKLNVNLSVTNLLRNCISKCCNNNESETEKLIHIISNNSHKYIDTEIVKKNEEISYNFLLSLADNGYSQVEIMKKFGFYSYSNYQFKLKSIFKEENISKHRQNELLEKIKKNRRKERVKIEYNTISYISDNTKKGLPSPEEDIIFATEDKTPEIGEKIDEGKVIIYSYDYLKDADLEDELYHCTDEKFITSISLSLYMKDKEISHNKKMIISNAIKDDKINLHVISITSEYNLPNVSQKILALENDMILSQALRLSFSLAKDIYIASTKQATILNALALEFGVRFPKKYVLDDFCNFELNKKDSSYFDYKIQKDDKHYDRAYVLDTCFIIGGNEKEKTTYRNAIRSAIFDSDDELKLVFKVVLEELVYIDGFISFMYVAKNNPSIRLVLDKNLQYNYNDLAIFNSAMYYKKKYNIDVTILTFDKLLYLESLQYGFNVICYECEFYNIISIPDNGNKNIVNNEKDNQDKPICKSLKAGKYGKNHILLNSVDIEKVLGYEDMKVKKLCGNSGFKYYNVEIGDHIKFKKEKNMYVVYEFDDKNIMIMQEDLQ